MRGTKRLSTLQINSLSKPGRYCDGLGLWLQISKYRTKAWIFRYWRDGKARQMGLGALHTVKLADARTAAEECRKLLLAGIDPIARRMQRRLDAAAQTANLVSFRQCGERYIAAHRPAWKNAKHREQWERTLETYVYSKIGDLAASAVDTPAVLKVVEPIWTTKPETANRVRGRIELVLDWATARGHRLGPNPARWRGHLDKLLPKRSKVATVRHHPALPYVDVPAFSRELRINRSVSAKALEFTLLTAARTTAVIGATWEEFDLKNKVWTVPPSRSGVKIVGDDPKPRRIPLSPRAIAILESLPGHEAGLFVFPSAKAKTSLSNMAMLELMRELRPGYVPHGLRSTFKDWCAETTNYPNEVSEAALWHAIADKTEAAYRRGELFEKRRRLANEWARYCESTPRKVGNAKVVSLRGGRRSEG